ncbi:hypothetical protein B4125_2939 [Bacillus paralicheniformis]|nr:hypothetical protein SC10_B2orf05787 [Bacillus paralicheniformis]OLG04867.1 hypothetical protein B4125_2939 [Bacillus paralicheniformis]TWJ61405.1 hypothetical protein CHCC5021_4153 [Bacillus paralicheniformis]TWL11056.1 hypothetical protein CHCC19468_1890 [Bacillus paralicheniformis]TWL18531.1 hypothetical protein CHCC19467_0947 [Bacillus paralicheniformis]
MFAAFFINCSVPPLLSSFIVIQLGYLKDFFCVYSSVIARRNAQHSMISFFT